MFRTYFTLLSLFFVSICYSQEFTGQNLIIVLDDSGSMDGYLSGTNNKRIDVAKKSIKDTLKNSNNLKCGIITLNGNGTNEGLWVFKPILINTSQINGLFSLIDKVDTGGSTPLSGAMKEAADELLLLKKQQRYGEYKQLILTDGAANNTGSVEFYLNDILSRGLKVDAIGLDMTSDHALATKVDAYRSANDSNSLMKALTETLAETNFNDNSSLEDYELSAIFPDGSASEVIDSFKNSGYHPIGEQPVKAKEILQNPDQYDQSIIENVEQKGSTFGSFVFWFMMMCLVLFVAFMFFVFID